MSGNSRNRVHAYSAVSPGFTMGNGVHQDCPLSLFSIFVTEIIMWAPLYPRRDREFDIVPDRQMPDIGYTDVVGSDRRPR